MKTLYSLGLALLLAFTVTGCELYFGQSEPDPDDDAYCAADGYYVRGEWVSAQCPGGGNECATDRDCAAGCYCDSATGTCDEAGFCSAARDCPDGFKCDDRSSCVPGGGSCAGAIAQTCTNGAPKCPEGSVPLVSDGCYYDDNGDGQFDCSAIAECAAAPTCDRFQHTNDCASAGCYTITRGSNCTTPTGQPCMSGSTNCTCASYEFQACQDAPAE